MPSCAFRKCSNNSRNTNKACGVTFHSFPKDPRYKEKWIKVIQEDQKDEYWLPKEYSRVCSVHFKANDLYLTALGRYKVKHSAIPALDLTADIKEEPVDPDEEGFQNVDVSDTDSIFDSPGIIYLKNKLDTEKSKKEKYKKEVYKLKRQNRYLKSKNTCLRELVKSLRRRILSTSKPNNTVVSIVYVKEEHQIDINN